MEDGQDLAQHEWAQHLEAHLPLAQPLDPGQQLPNLMPAITTLIMNIASNMSNGNAHLAHFFQPLVNMALSMQFQVWQQAATAPALPDMLQMQLVSMAAAAPQAGLAIESNVTEQHEQVAVAAQHEAAAAPGAAVALPEGQQQAAMEQPAMVGDAGAGTAQADPGAAAQPAAVAAVSPAAAAAAVAAAAAAAAVDAAAGVAPSYRETYESEGTDEGEGDAHDEDDEDYSAKGERGGRRGQRASGAQRPQRVRKRSKMLTEYLTDEEGEGGSGGGRAAKRRAHLE